MRMFLFLLLIPLMISTSYAAAQSTQISVSSNQESYSIGDSITISGTITYPGQANSAVLQIYNPANILVQIGTITFGADGSYTTTVKTGGEAWSNLGTYTIKVIYVSPPDNAVATRTINMVGQSGKTQSNPNTNPSNQTQDSSLDEKIQQRIEFAKKLRDALNNTSSTQQNETGQIPFWVKDTARKWHDGTIDNVSFGKVIQYMISQGLVKISYSITPDDTFDHIPSWVKNTAQWWTQGEVSDNTFFDSIQYLLDQQIIRT